MKVPKRKPNVIVFFTDQQRWDCSDLHGNPLDLMPNFDRIARQGTHLANCFTPQPVCGPARACLQTGTYATTTGCWRNGIPLPTDARTLAHHFRDGGYSTGYIGKWHLADRHPDCGPVIPEQRGGYEYWLASNALEFTSEAYSTTLFDNDLRPVELPGYRVDALTDAAIRYIDQHHDDPFFLFISYIEPHHQNRTDDYPAPEGYRERYAGRWVPPDLAALPGYNPNDPHGGTTHQHLAGYYGMVKRLDEAYGRLLDALRSLNLRDDTIVLFTSDHGCHFKTRNSEYKRSCHESSIRVPGSITGPGFEGGGHVRELVSLVDLPPTLLDAAGLPVPAEMQGRSILPLLRGKRTAWPEEVLCQLTELSVGRCVRTHRWKYSVGATEDAKVENGAADKYFEEFLYDLECDPYELKNLVGFESHREVADNLRERLLRRMAEIGEAQSEIVPAPPISSGKRQILSSEFV